MNSFILIGNQDDRNRYIKQFVQQKEIRKFDMHVFEPQETSFGIAEIRDIQKKAFLKPTANEKILILEKAELLTKEAQNALLKLLEEPPANTYIFLSAQSDNFLPTIVSRCKAVVVTKEKQVEEREDFPKFLKLVEQGSLAEKLALAEQITVNKERIDMWFDSCILSLRKRILAEPMNPFYLSLIRQVQDARTLFQTTNVSPREILEHCFLSL